MPNVATKCELSSSPVQTCCTAGETCTKVNPYYSKCDKPTPSGLLGKVRDSCPGLVECPADDMVEA